MENKPQIGLGIYTVPDLAQILNLKYFKVQRALNDYWDKRIAGDFGDKYSWFDGKSKAVNFHTLIEFFTYFQLKEAGAKSRDIIDTHQALSKMYNTMFPFANLNIMQKLGTFGKRIVFELEKDIIIDANGAKQLNLLFIKAFIKKIDFGKEEMAIKLWPLGKDRSVVVDPEHQFGQPTIFGTNIIPITLYNLSLANEPIPFIAATYDITEDQVKDAISYCQRAA